MRAPRRPVWSDGMLLSPQHLQSLERHQEAVVAARVGAVAPEDWGVLSCELDASALAAGQARVVRFAGVLPDGLPVELDEATGDAPPPRAIAEHLPPAARQVDVYLAVARERDGVPSFAEEAQAQRVRFASSSRPVEDATAPGQQLSVALARANAVLLFGDEAREDFEVVKIEARAVEDLTYGFGIFARIYKGTTVRWERSKVDGDSWMPARLEIRADARVLLFRRVAVYRVTDYFNYRKFAPASASWSLTRQPGS